MDIMTLILVTTLCTSWVALFVSLFALRCYRRDRKELQDKLAFVGKELRISQSGSMGMGRRLRSIEKRLRLTSDRQEELYDSQKLEKADYQQAARLLAGGGSLDEVAASCGISRSEVSLLSLVKKGSAA